MPTALQRVQCLLQPETFALVKTLAGDERRTMSNMAAELIEKALKLPEVQAQIDAALIKVPTPDDPRASVPQRQVVNRQSYNLTPEEAEKLRAQRSITPIPTGEIADRVGSNGLTMAENVRLVNAKRAGVKSKEITEASRTEDKDSKKEMLKALLLEIMTE